MKAISIIKPGIIFGNIVTVCGGFFLGSQQHIHLLLLLATIVGMALVVACGCVLNNIIDRDIDQLMQRTKDRILARGMMPLSKAYLYALVCGVIGFAVLWFFTNKLTVLVSTIGLIFYVVVYSLILKRKSTWGTVLGAVAGAVPPVVGFTAATNQFNSGAIILFLILFFWQMPHFYAIAIFRLDDYKIASIPVLPIIKGKVHTKKIMFYYCIAFAIAAIAPTLLGYAGILYFIIALVLGLVWLYQAWLGFKVQDDRTWARKMFLISIIDITLLSIAMAI